MYCLIAVEGAKRTDVQKRITSALAAEGFKVSPKRPAEKGAGIGLRERGKAIAAVVDPPLIADALARAIAAAAQRLRLAKLEVLSGGDVATATVETFAGDGDSSIQDLGEEASEMLHDWSDGEYVHDSHIAEESLAETLLDLDGGDGTTEWLWFVKTGAPANKAAEPTVSPQWAADRVLTEVVGLRVNEATQVLSILAQHPSVARRDLAAALGADADLVWKTLEGAGLVRDGVLPTRRLFMLTRRDG